MRLINKERTGFGGVITIAACLVLVLVLNIVTVWQNITTSRAIAEQAERIVSLQCLSSNYINNKDVFADYNMGATSTFPSITKDGSEIKPVEQFNSILSEFGISQSGVQGITVSYYKDGSDKYVCKVQAAPFKIDGILNTVAPDPVYSVIEDK